jgi:hypothetical protein
MEAAFTKANLESGTISSKLESIIILQGIDSDPTTPSPGGPFNAAFPAGLGIPCDSKRNIST